MQRGIIVARFGIAPNHLGAMMKTVNLTQHKATPDQLGQGVFDLDDNLRVRLQELLTFDTLPTKSDVASRAIQIVRLVQAAHIICDAAMIGGAPFLMADLQFQLSLQKIQPLFAFSMRESTEIVDCDGTVTKTNVFRHVGFVGGV